MVFLCSCGGLIWENRVHVCGHRRCSCGWLQYEGRGHCCGYIPDYSKPSTDWELYSGYRCVDEWMGSPTWGKRSPRLFETKFEETRILNTTSSMEDIKNSQQTGSFQEYCNTFDFLLNKVILSEDYATSLFVGGLKSEIKWWVMFLSPKTLKEAYEVAMKQNNLLTTCFGNKEFKKVEIGSSCVKHDEEFSESTIQTIDESEKGVEVQEYIDVNDSLGNGRLIDNGVSRGNAISGIQVCGIEDSKEGETDNARVLESTYFSQITKVESARQVFDEMPGVIQESIKVDVVESVEGSVNETSYSDLLPMDFSKAIETHEEDALNQDIVINTKLEGCLMELESEKHDECCIEENGDMRWVKSANMGDDSKKDEKDNINNQFHNDLCNEGNIDHRKLRKSHSEINKRVCSSTCLDCSVPVDFYVLKGNCEFEQMNELKTVDKSHNQPKVAETVHKAWRLVLFEGRPDETNLVFKYKRKEGKRRCVVKWKQKNGIKQFEVQELKLQESQTSLQINAIMKNMAGRIIEFLLFAQMTKCIIEVEIAKTYRSTVNDLSFTLTPLPVTKLPRAEVSTCNFIGLLSVVSMFNTMKCIKKTMVHLWHIWNSKLLELKFKMAQKHDDQKNCCYNSMNKLQNELHDTFCIITILVTCDIAYNHGVASKNGIKPNHYCFVTGAFHHQFGILHQIRLKLDFTLIEHYEKHFELITKVSFNEDMGDSSENYVLVEILEVNGPRTRAHFLVIIDEAKDPSKIVTVMEYEYTLGYMKELHPDDVAKDFTI